jgi:AcrR family transcriptional regulator
MLNEKPPRRDRKQELREKLLSVAREMIAERGLLDFSTRKVADAAGTALGSLYTVFVDVDALVFAVNLESFERLDGLMQEAAAGAATAEEKLSALVWAYLGFARAEPHLWRAMFEHQLPEGRTVPAENLEALAGLMQNIAEPLREVNPELDDAARLTRARTLFAAFHGVISMSLDHRLLGVADEALESELRALLGTLFRGREIASLET